MIKDKKFDMKHTWKYIKSNALGDTNENRIVLIVSMICKNE